MPDQFTGRATDPPLPTDTSGRRAFWDVWNTELKLRERIMTHRPLNWRLLAQSYRRTNAMMPYAPQTHLRRLSKLVDWDVSDQIEDPGQWVYMVWTVLDPRPYFGQCGAIGEQKTVLKRFSEEILPWQLGHVLYVVYGNKRRRVPLYIYLLRKLGTHAFSVIPVRRTTVSNTDHVEIWHIRHATPNMNTAHTKRRQYYRWLHGTRQHQEVPASL